MWDFKEDYLATGFKPGDLVRCVGVNCEDARFGPDLPIGTELVVRPSGCVQRDGWHYLVTGGHYVFDLVRPAQPERVPARPAQPERVPASPGPVLAKWLERNFAVQPLTVQAVLREIAREVLRVEIVQVPAAIRFEPARGEDR